MKLFIKIVIMIQLALYSFLFSYAAFACSLSIPERDVSRFLNPPVSGHYLKCEDYPEDKCHCVESIDPWSAELIDGELVENSDKKFQKELREKIERDERKAKEDKKKAFKFKGSTIKELRDELNEWVDSNK